jgi:hypothetical protein
LGQALLGSDLGCGRTTIVGRDLLLWWGVKNEYDVHVACTSQLHAKLLARSVASRSIHVRHGHDCFTITPQNETSGDVLEEQIRHTGKIIIFGKPVI